MFVTTGRNADFLRRNTSYHLLLLMLCYVVHPEIATNNVCKISNENIFKHTRLHINTSIIFYEICRFVLTGMNQQNIGTMT